MTVKELIDKLSELPQDLRVLVSGYEGGYRDLENVGGESIFAADVNSAWYYGPHEEVDKHHAHEGKVHFKGVVL